MKKKYIIAANWKMNGTKGHIKSYIKDLSSYTKSKDYLNIILAFPNVFLDYASDISENFEICAQNVFFENNGAYTGEVSTDMLKNIGIKYVILGHSERRIYFFEKNYDISRKLEKSISSNLKVILCVGENEKERDLNQTKDIIFDQISTAVKNIKDISNLIIAYEPVWAIGTGKTADINQIKDVHEFIKQKIFDIYNKDIQVLYGGSVNKDNIVNFLNKDYIDGFLIGSASLKIESFKSILEKVL